MAEIKEINETSQVDSSSGSMDADFEAELDSKVDEYNNKSSYDTENKTLEELKQDRLDLLYTRREELLQYKQMQEANFLDSDDEDEDPEKVLVLKRTR